jgi:hypothetical protein
MSATRCRYVPLSADGCITDGEGVGRNIAAWSQTFTGDREHATPVFCHGSNMPLPTDINELLEAVAGAMVADILEAFTLEEIRQLIEEMEAKVRKLH